MPSIKRWKACAAFLRPNGMRKNLKSPKGVKIAVLGTSAADNGIWWNLFTRSMVEKICMPASLALKS